MPNSGCEGENEIKTNLKKNVLCSQIRRIPTCSINRNEVMAEQLKTEAKRVFHAAQFWVGAQHWQLRQWKPAQPEAGAGSSSRRCRASLVVWGQPVGAELLHTDTSVWKLPARLKTGHFSNLWLAGCRGQGQFPSLPLHLYGPSSEVVRITKQHPHPAGTVHLNLSFCKHSGEAGEN